MLQCGAGGATLPQVQLAGDDTYIQTSANDRQQSAQVDGSSLSFSAKQWSDELNGPYMCQPGTTMSVVNAMTVAVLIASDPGARTPNHIEPHLLGAVNSLIHGPRGKLWHFFPADFPERVASLMKERQHHALYTKRCWKDWTLEPGSLIKLGVKRVLQPEGYEIFSMPVRRSLKPWLKTCHCMSLT